MRLHARNARWPGGRIVRAAAMLLLVNILAMGAQAEGFAYDLAGELMSPFCPGRTLASCPSPQAAELVQWISLQEAAGATREDVIEMLIDRFGEEILGAPPAKGITLWAYVFPVAGFLVGGGLVALALRRLVRRGVVAESDTGPDGGSGQAVEPDGAFAGGPGEETTSDADAELARLVDAELAGRGDA